MSYIEVSKGKFGGSSTPNNVLRVSKSSITVAPNIAERFQLSRTSNPTATSEREVVKLGLAVDKEANRIKLLPNSINGFSFGTTTNGTSLTVAKPKSLVRMGVDTGDYLLVGPTDNLEFERQ